MLRGTLPHHSRCHFLPRAWWGLQTPLKQGQWERGEILTEGGICRFGERLGHQRQLRGMANGKLGLFGEVFCPCWACTPPRGRQWIELAPFLRKSTQIIITTHFQPTQIPYSHPLRVTLCTQPCCLAYRPSSTGLTSTSTDLRRHACIHTHTHIHFLGLNKHRPGGCGDWREWCFSWRQAEGKATWLQVERLNFCLSIYLSTYLPTFHPSLTIYPFLIGLLSPRKDKGFGAAGLYRPGESG
jgi:hypothetical protein